MRSRIYLTNNVRECTGIPSTIVFWYFFKYVYKDDVFRLLLLGTTYMSDERGEKFFLDSNL